MASSKKGIIVNTIIAVVIAVVFVLMASSLIYNFFGNLPRVSGAMINAADALCFEDGDSGHFMFCVSKATGEQLFSVGAGSKWASAKAVSTPALTKNGVYFGLGNYFCAYNPEGMAIMDCQKLGHTVVTGVTVDESKGIACFGDNGTHMMYCMSSANAGQAFSVHGNWGDCPGGNCNAESTPAISGGAVYFGLGNRVCRVSADSTGLIESKDIKKVVGKSWCSAKLGSTVPTGIAVSPGGDIVCFGDGTGGKIHCLKTSDGSEVSAVDCNSIVGVTPSACKILSTPTITGSYIYFSMAKHILRYPFSSAGTGTFVPDAAGPDVTISSSDIISTGIAVNESLGYACFGAGAEKTVNCVNTTNLKEVLLTVRARDEWDATKAISTPVLENGTLYLALGTHICAFKVPVTKGWENKDFSDSSYRSKKDPDVVWTDFEGGCTEVEGQIVTGLATFAG
ncbi:MAG: hypothetical protein V1839_00410 [archaeon]